MISHLANQQVVNELLVFELLELLLETPTEDSVELAVDIMIESGQVLTELAPKVVEVTFEWFKSILHEGKCSKRVQYTIENLFSIWKQKFKGHEGVPVSLDLIEEEDKITHNIELNDKSLDEQNELNFFRVDN